MAANDIISQEDRLKMRTKSIPSSSLLYSVALALLLGVLTSSACAPAGPASGAAPEAGDVQTIQNKGSDTIVNLALAWAEAYTAQHPEVRIAVTGGGSGTGIAALINGTVDIANASRAMKPEELERARANGIEPVEHVIAADAIAVVVHPSNPVDGLTIDQLSDIFTGQVTNWRKVGGEDRPIVLLSRESNSGTHIYFLEEVVRKGEKGNQALFSPDTLLMPSSEGISHEIRQNPNAIGYDGLGYVTEDQKTLAVAIRADEPYVLPTVATVKDGSYPIARSLYMYTNGQPTGVIKDYLDWILSDEGQAIVRELGFVPLR
ncbi:MAG: phosphate ABC transporter substrate-binding protein PstS family protein [Anaerolineae bacterium]|nr:phosphate ABC transporter substrate-binding protein PstS family protein [Anaerolineae bacterium]